MKAKFYNCPGTKRIFFQLTILTVFIFTTPLFSQSFPISTQPSERYSIDKYNSEVYYLTYLTDEVYKKNLLTGNTELSMFPTLPTFANKSHLCVYGQGDSIFVYNFVNNIHTFICLASILSVGRFSPEDNYIIYKDYYYSFKDSATYPLLFYSDGILQWLNDSTIIVNLYPDDYIYSFCFTTGILDTIYIQPSGFIITTFSYDEVKTDLYYCLYDPWQPNYSKIRVKNLNTQTDSIVFDSFIDDPTNICWQSMYTIRSMEWFQQTSSLAFFGSGITYPASGIYVYRALDKKVYRYTDCDDAGIKGFINWYNKDTIIYVSIDDLMIMGFFLDSPVHVEDQKEFSKEIPEISAYPNPFNGSVNILIKGFQAEQLYIYNLQGEKVRALKNGTMSSREDRLFIWDGKNEEGIDSASGLYFIKVDNPAVNVTGKIIYIK